MEGERNNESPSLVGLQVERVDRPRPGLFAITLRGKAARTVLLIAAGPPRRNVDWALTAERPRGDPADASVRGLRERLEGARITSAWRSGARLGLALQLGEMGWCVETSSRGLTIVPSHDGNIIERDPLSETDLEAARRRGDRFEADHALQVAEDQRIELRRSLKSLRVKLERRCAAIDDDRRAIVDAEAKAERAAMFVPAAARAIRGATHLVATDWSTGDPCEITFDLDPAKGPREQLETVFARARRLRNGAVRAQQRRDDAELAMMMIDEAIDTLGEADEAAMHHLVARLRRELPGDIRLPAPRTTAGHSRDRDEKRLPYRSFIASTGEAILVGRSSRDNDELTLSFAKLGDLWLHVRGRPGAHVVLRQDGRAASPNALIDAATLAAHFSEQRDESIVDVTYCERRYVMKRRGSATGQVELKKESVVAVRREADRLARLLDTEGR